MADLTVIASVGFVTGAISMFPVIRHLMKDNREIQKKYAELDSKRTDELILSLQEDSEQ